MRIAKRIFLFMVVNILIVVTVSTVASMLGIGNYITADGLDYAGLAMFCAIWGFAGAFISLALSRVMAKWMMGVKIISPGTHDPQLRDLVSRVHALARRAGITTMPEVGIYEGEELNAFATGPTKNRALVAVSTGLLHSMNEDEVQGVLAHEVAHVANGDMVTMTLVQGVVNSFVMFLARIAAFAARQAVDEEKGPMVQFAVTIVLEIVLGILGMIVVSYFSRIREYRADYDGARLSSREQMVAALQRLKLNYEIPMEADQPALASLKISGRPGRFLRLFSTHPDLDDRIARLMAPAR